MSDEKRPNAKYSLSNPDNTNPSDDEKIIHHYNRERRLANAPKEVQDLYKEQKPFRFGLLGPLVADRPRRFLFFSIIFLCILIFIISRMGFFETRYILEGNRIDISGLRVEGNTIVRLRKIAQSTDIYTGAVEIAVFVPVQSDEEQFVFRHRIFFTLDKEEESVFTVPFDEPELLVVLQSERENLVRLRLKPE